MQMTVSRRVYVRAYRAYLDADLAWQHALDEAALLVPGVRGPHAWQIGAPGSRLRRIYEARSRTLERLAVVRLTVRNAKARQRRPRLSLPSG